jgi:hypothetical protein
MDEPQPKSWVRPAAGGGNKACQGIGWTAPLVTNGDHDTVRCGPETHSHRCAPVKQCVGDCLRDADQQVFQDRVGDTAAADLRERLPGLGRGPVGQLDHGHGLFKWIGGEGETFEYRSISEAVVRTMGARRRNDAGMRPFGEIEDGGGRRRGVIQAQAPHREVGSASGRYRRSPSPVYFADRPATTSGTWAGVPRSSAVPRTSTTSSALSRCTTTRGSAARLRALTVRRSL